MALMSTILQGALAGAFVGGAISGAMGLRSASTSANRIDGAEYMHPDLVLPVMELQTHIGVNTTRRLVKLLNQLCQLASVSGSGASRKVLLTAADDAHRKRQAIHMEVSKLWANSVQSDTPDSVATKLQDLFKTVNDQTNRIVNNIDVTVDSMCGSSASALLNKELPDRTESEM